VTRASPPARVTSASGTRRKVDKVPHHTDAVIAGVNKAGTTSLFVSLSTHPDVTPSAIKETRYFLAPRWGQALAPFSVYEDYFRDAPDRAVRLEATPSYFYGGDAVARAMQSRLTDPHVIVVLREPVARAISFFKYQKVRLRFPSDLPIEQYLAEADRLGPDDFGDPANEKYLAFQGGCYADYLPAWLDAFGTSRLRVVWFEDLVGEPAPTLASVAQFVGLDPARFPADSLSSENRTTGFRSAWFQRLALSSNDRFERVLRRHPDAKRRIRSLYYRLNGTPAHDVVPDHVVDELRERYREPNARLVAQLAQAGVALPSWLEPEPTAASA